MTRTTPKLIVALLVGAVALGGSVGYAITRPGGSGALRAADSLPVREPLVSTVGLAGGRVPWYHPLILTVTDGSLTSVTATDPDGHALDGELTDGGGWTSSHQLLPASTYTLTATVKDKAGKSRQVSLSALTTPPSRTLHAVLSPGDGKVVGVGMTVIATLDRAVSTAADRALVEARLTVSTSPAVPGAWRWMSPTELHYRGPSYWASGTKIRASADFTRLRLSDGTWGEGVRDTAYSIGSRVVATVDVTAHVMKVVVNGKLVRTVKVSTGRDKYPTKGGAHLVLEKTKLKIMDSATVGIPRKSPDGYYEKVPNSVRISYGGAFVHSADWSVRDQGVRNVSHGCVNISPADAAWFFDLVKRGDVVDVIHASVGPKLSDPGMSDWNVPFASWAN
ncbi:MAG: ErfK/YbiS/YcfS/YnhG family protein [Frankiales bacterium]|nr:ErfK/YbiS/YcfS/YnhG family protein [Frankiales bacterium]